MSTNISILNVKDYDSIFDAIKTGITLIADTANTINFTNGEYPEFLRRECISCLCCMEMCSQKAIKPKLRGFGGLFHSY